MDRIPRTATVAISAFTVLAWLITSIAFPGEAAMVLGFTPARLSGGDVPWAVIPAFLTPLTATIAHAGLVHIGFNMLMLAWCGMAVERVLGPWGLIILYVVGAYAAAAGQWLADPMGVIPMSGASGAVSAVLGAYSLSFGRAKQLTRSVRVNRWLNSAWLLVAWVGLQLAIGWLAGVQGVLLATPAHIGGFLAGILLQRPLLLWRYRRA
ncbi:rhomboid family intramembrane serine protease [Sphingomonas hankyongi]|uniref:Rhomboid family intramembrane serine protease n=1 Tax=Sphingomonas hankyongi TaxID=2908209 RepID=A0ABT0S3K4_9SPHN|nr:rhomboid family intramembrane serine protease [Sphingomonas hankyongi]MCL6730411.1 rhomboid family intramembrane serine protease [Sphingomonas hankyongi]